MNKAKLINWKAFKDTLLQHRDLDLQFQYAAGKLVDAGYHITEIKQALITSVDCGGVLDAWTEVIVQLWVPENTEQEGSMKVSKALSIINIVEKMLPLNPNATVKIEFGNSDFDTRQMFPSEMIVDSDSLTVSLCPDEVQCKAVTRGGSCGTNEKPEIQLAASAEACCIPGGGCC
ncbi:MAG TPA: DUF6428 family protein [Mucilaginibacter sp.]